MPPGRCSDCYLPPEICACDQWAPCPCGVEVIILRHALETHRVSNTGRLVAANLAGSSIITHGDGQPPRTPRLRGAVLLWPEGGERVPSAAPRQLVILDATWSQARRMRQRIPWLRGLPTLSLGAAPNRPRLRRANTAGQRSTAEAVAEALRLLGEDAAAAHLDHRLLDLIRRLARPGRTSPDARATPASERHTPRKAEIRLKADG